MVVSITLENSEGTEFVLPYRYPEYIQAFLYHLNDPEFGNFLHDVGYRYNGRTFKLFSYSRILEKPLQIIRDKHLFIFPERISFMVSTVENPMLEALLGSICQFQQTFYLGRYTVEVTSVELLSFPVSSNLVVQALSPVCIYSTAMLPDGRKRTIYYMPREKEFSELLCQNAIKKYKAYYQKEPENSTLKIIPYGRTREIVSFYRGFIIKGYMGRFRLVGSEELIKIVTEAGLGGKNAEGNGFIIPVIETKDNEILAIE